MGGARRAAGAPPLRAAERGGCGHNRWGPSRRTGGQGTARRRPLPPSSTVAIVDGRHQVDDLTVRDCAGQRAAKHSRIVRADGERRAPRSVKVAPEARVVLESTKVQRRRVRRGTRLYKKRSPAARRPRTPRAWPKRTRRGFPRRTRGSWPSPRRSAASRRRVAHNRAPTGP